MAASPHEPSPSGDSANPKTAAGGKTSGPRAVAAAGCLKQILYASPACLIFLPLIMTWKLTVVIGLGVVVYAGWLAVREHRRLESSQIVAGTVVKIDYFPGSGRSAGSYQPHVRYTTNDGIVRDFVPYNSGEAGVEINEQVVLAYDQATQNVRLVTFGRRFGWATFLAVIGLSLMMLGVAFLAGRHYVPWIYARQLSTASVPGR